MKLAAACITHNQTQNAFNMIYFIVWNEIEKEIVAKLEKNDKTQVQCKGR